MAANYIDWRFAAKTGRGLTAGGPRISASEASEAVAELRDAARRAHEPVAITSGLHTSFDEAKAGKVEVVDRARWIETNIESLHGMLGPVIDKITAKRYAGPLARMATSKVSATELGGLMAFMSSKVLGQYDIAPDGTPSLMLGAPKRGEAEQQLGVDPHDFRLWVCLHEETHRVQFTAVPWLRDHVVNTARDLMVEMAPTPEDLAERIVEIAKRVPESFRAGSNGLGDIFATPEQRERLAELTAVMSLLEGHADVVMDDVGPQVVPSVEFIRERFQERRGNAGGVDRLLRRLMGLEAKMRQYRDGANFVRAVHEKVGVDGFNAVWETPENLPKPLEIQTPQLWVERVHGSLFK